MWDPPFWDLRAEKAFPERVINLENEIFRKKSLDRIKSPDDLDIYLQVQTPAVWMILGAVIALLGGLTFWMFTANVENTLSAHAVCEGGLAVMTLSIEDGRDVAAGMKVRIGNVETSIEAVSDPGMGQVKASAPAALPDGTYEAVIVTKTMNPIDLLTVS